MSATEKYIIKNRRASGDTTAYVNSILKYSQNNFLILKVLSDQLPVAELCSVLMNKSNVCVIGIMRNPLQTFISYKKALSTEMWVHGDYSDCVITFNEVEFRDYLNETIVYWRSVITKCELSGKPLVLVYYEDLFEHHDSHSARLQHIITTISGQYVLPKLMYIAADHNQYAKQNSRQVQENFTNYDMLLAYLERHDLLGLLDGKAENVKSIMAFLIEQFDVDTLFAS